MLINVRPGQKIEYHCSVSQKRTVDALHNIGYDVFSIHQGVNHDDTTLVGLKKGKSQTLYVTVHGEITTNL